MSGITEDSAPHLFFIFFMLFILEMNRRKELRRPAHSVQTPVEYGEKPFSVLFGNRSRSAHKSRMPRHVRRRVTDSEPRDTPLMPSSSLLNRFCETGFDPAAAQYS